ncbi:unnamed protein product, partial [Effrenium voratum]
MEHSLGSEQEAALAEEPQGVSPKKRARVTTRPGADPPVLRAAADLRTAGQGTVVSVEMYIIE